MHVLSLPPAFVLSQDQTLKLYENSYPDWSLIIGGMRWRIRLTLTSSFAHLANQAPAPASRRTRKPIVGIDCTLKKRDRRSVSHKTPPLIAARATAETVSPQGPRRPRLSSFRCNCQTACPTGLSLPRRRPAPPFRPLRSLNLANSSPSRRPKPAKSRPSPSLPFPGKSGFRSLFALIPTDKPAALTSAAPRRPVAAI